MMKRSTPRPFRRTARGFTLIEILIAVAVLLVILLAVSRIFASVSAVTSLGQVNADIMQEVAAIERQMRQDIDSLAPDGFFAIVSHRVRNDLHDPSSADPRLWLDPNRPADEWLRSDQLVFFSNRTQSVQVFARGSGVGINRKPQSNVSRVYWGHGFQLPNAISGTDLALNAAQQFFPPWHRATGANTQMVNTLTGNAVAPIDGTQPVAPRWLLARQAILLADDGGDPTYFGSLNNDLAAAQGNSSISLFDRYIRNSRFDASSEQVNVVRNNITQFNDPGWPWAAQRASMLQYVFFPRSERESPSMFRQDHALTVPTIGSASSEFAVEWSWETGTVNFTNTGPAESLVIPSNQQHPWFGMPDVAEDIRGTRTLDQFTTSTSQTYPANIETYQVVQPRRHVYTAVFGYNRTLTPWPASLRITMRLHDVNQRLPEGRTVQFVVNLPERAR